MKSQTVENVQIEKNKSISGKSQKSLGGFVGLKAIAMLLLFWWHSSFPSPNTDLGARTCEFLFVVSGFLVGYNYYYKGMDGTWDQSINYAKGKLIKFWPLHFVTFIMALIFNVITIQGFLTYDNAISAVLNVLLLHAWGNTPDVYFSYNGASWFLSALIFCYFLAPLMLKAIKNIKVSSVLFFVIAFVRYALEFVNDYFPGAYWDLRMHTSPLVRSLEFFLGMLMVPVCMYLKEKYESKKILVTLWEILALLLTVAIAITKNEVWPRSLFVFVSALLVFVYSFDAGLLSKFFSTKIFRLFGGIQFEFYIFHQIVIVILSGILSGIITNSYVMGIISFVTIIACAYIYRKFMADKLSNCMSSIIKKVEKVFE